MLVKNVVTYSTVALLVFVCAPMAMGQTGFCVTDPAFGQEWSLENFESAGAVTFDMTMTRTGFPTIPLPAAGALDVNPAQGQWDLTWDSAFAGATQGTVEYACKFTQIQRLPMTGDGMMIRHINTNNLDPELFTGTCRLDVCGASSVGALPIPDPLTQQ